MVLIDSPDPNPDRDVIGIVRAIDQTPLFSASMNHTAGHPLINIATPVSSPLKQPRDPVHKKQVAVVKLRKRAVICPPPRTVDFRMTQSCYLEIMMDLCSQPPEQAGVLFGPVGDVGLVTHYCPDEAGSSTSVSFTLDADFVNRKIKIFKAAQMEMKGFVHSHPQYFNRLSGGDLAYLRKIIGKPKNSEVELIFMPIVCGERLIPFAVDTSLNVTEANFQLV